MGCQHSDLAIQVRDLVGIYYFDRPAHFHEVTKDHLATVELQVSTTQEHVTQPALG